MAFLLGMGWGFAVARAYLDFRDGETIMGAWSAIVAVCAFVGCLMAISA